MVDTSPSPYLSRSSTMSSISSSSSVSLGAPSPASSIQFAEGDVEVVTEEGVPHVNYKLDAKQYKWSSFAAQLLKVLRKLKVPGWHVDGLSASHIQVQKVSGTLTNAVFFVSYLQEPALRKLLLRIYGPSSGSLISRPRELHTLHVLSSQYRIGPRVYGTFENGRIEEYFDSTTLTPTDIRNPVISRWIGARMAELHSVDIDLVQEDWRTDGCPLAVKKNIQSWTQPAMNVLSLPHLRPDLREALDITRFKQAWSRYEGWLSQVDNEHDGSQRVFCHNDAQYGNLLRLNTVKAGVPDHRQIIVVDFEYAAPNPASFDIANHFHEWTTDYNSSTPHLLRPEWYPAYEERRNFYVSYLQHVPHSTHGVPLSREEEERQLSRLDAQVRYWSPAVHAMWYVWSLVQAREDVEANIAEPEFDYLGYAQSRLEGFHREIKELGL